MTKVPAQPPTSGETTVMVLNTFPLTCRIVFWGPANVTIDADANGGAALRLFTPGTYGWRAFIGGAETGEAGNLEIAAGNACLFVCDKDKRAIVYACH